MRRGLWLGAGAVAIAVAAGVYVWHGEAPPPAPQTAAIAPQPAPAAKPAAPEMPAPSFDIVRVDPGGHLVIAGRATPGARVRVLEGGKTIGEVSADARGEWVLVPDAPLSPGDHRIGIEATDGRSGAKRSASDTVALVVAPPSSPATTVAVLVPDKGDKPAQVLQQPGGAPASGKLTIDTAEADGSGSLAVTGHAAPGAAVTLYAGNGKLGAATADASGKWSLTATLPPGGEGFELRAETPAANGAVAQRATEPYAPPKEAVAIPAGERYVVKPGNNLWLLARLTYGEGTRYTMIYQANRGNIHDPNLIYPGQVFLIPKQR